MEAALTALILGDAGITALVGDRVYWTVLPQGLVGWPRVRLTVIDAPHSYHFRGRSSMSRSMVQIDVFATEKRDAVACRQAIDALLSGFKGVAHGVEFCGVFVTGGGDSDDKKIRGVDVQLHRTRIDLAINWKTEG